MATSKLRLDELLVARSLAQDLRTAQALVLAGQVVVGERRADKPGEQVRPDVAVRLKDQSGPYVSRGGLKLEAALDVLNVDVRGLSCADVGASTGGFCDCLLQRGAARVVAIDVGYGLLHDKLRRDPRVTVRERTHARELTAAGLPFAIELLVADLSFIGLQSLLPVLLGVVAAGGRLLLMVKPQFEAARSEVPVGGVIADSELAARIVDRVAIAARAHGAHVLGTAAAGVAGPAGNREVFLALRTPH
ncbi:MAG: TlyA family RNA methyltransferase [Myxococcales bacterium]|nr:TlyA family RNA methyltransferase [Myxococcales bacterium]